MPSESTTYKDAASEVASSVTEKLSDAASAAKSKVSDLGRTAADKIDENRDAAASGLETAASTLHEKAENRKRNDPIFANPCTIARTP